MLIKTDEACRERLQHVISCKERKNVSWDMVEMYKEMSKENDCVRNVTKTVDGFIQAVRKDRKLCETGKNENGGGMFIEKGHCKYNECHEGRCKEITQT